MSDLDIRSTPRRREVVSERGRAALEHLPWVYLRVAKRISPARPVVGGSTDLVIEGYPRSGNSFLLSWIDTANPQITIASHIHSIAHVHAALRREIPVVVVIRPPEAAIASHAVFSPDLPLEHMIDRYRRFHLGIARVVDRVIISPFPVTTGAPERVVEALRPVMSVPLADAPPGGRDEVMADLERRTVAFHGSVDETRVARPTTARTAATERVLSRLRDVHRDEMASLRRLHDRLAEAPSSLGIT